MRPVKIKHFCNCTVLISLILSGLPFHLFSQTIFSENFNEANGATNGTDNTGGVNWTAVCGTCVSGDWFNVQSNTLECDDTNGPATWTTNSINTSSCATGYQVSFDISVNAATNAFEECASGCGCNCVDWVSFEYNPSSSGYVPCTSSQGGTCTEGCSGGTYIVLGDLSGPNTYTFTQCLPPSNNVRLRISVQTWAAGERYRIDNITLQCMGCVLPVELVKFDTEADQDKIILNWETATENNSDYFIIERSASGNYFEAIDSVKAKGNSIVPQFYQFIDHHPLPGINYYRLKTTDLNGEYTYTPIKVEYYNASAEWNVITTENGLLISGCSEGEKVFIYDISGRLIHSSVISSESGILNFNSPHGIYLITTENNGKQKLISK